MNTQQILREKLLQWCCNKEGHVMEFTWYSQTMWLLHKTYNIRFFFPIRSHYFDCALSGILIKVKCTPLITTNSEFSIGFMSWMDLCIPLFKPVLCSSPVSFILRRILNDDYDYELWHSPFLIKTRGTQPPPSFRLKNSHSRLYMF